MQAFYKPSTTAQPAIQKLGFLNYGSSV